MPHTPQPRPRTLLPSPRLVGGDGPSLAHRLSAGLLVLLLGVCLVVTLVVPSGASAATRESAKASLPVARRSCGAASPDQVRCLAEVLVSPTTHKPIHPNPVGVSHPTVRTRAARAAGIAPAARAGRSHGRSAPVPETPAYLQQAYDLTYLSAVGGVGDTIAVTEVGGDPEVQSDLARFRATFGLPPCTIASGCLRVINEDGQSSPLPATDWTWAQEESLDLEAASSLCPNCHLLVVEANDADVQDLGNAISAAVEAGANQVSNSWSEDSAQNPYPRFSFPDASILAATGDDGVIPAGTSAFPAALPDVTAVGGTSLYADPKDDPTVRGFNETPWSQSGAGCDVAEAALPYQPPTDCQGRPYADVSADANPATGLMFYDRQAGGWLDGGGTSLATPLVAAFEAVTGVNGTSPEWAYADRDELNNPTISPDGDCASTLGGLCNAGTGYDGFTGAGSISGAVTTGAPGVAAPAYGPAAHKTYAVKRGSSSVTLKAGLYTNGEPTTYYWQYGTSSYYTARTPTHTVAANSAAVRVTAVLRHLLPGRTYHFRLVAYNATASADGYDYTVTTRAVRG